MNEPKKHNCPHYKALYLAEGAVKGLWRAVAIGLMALLATESYLLAMSLKGNHALLVDNHTLEQACSVTLTADIK